MDIKEAYDTSAADYDAARRKIVPNFDLFYGSVVEVLEAYGIRDGMVLDLGAGTGILAGHVAKAFPSIALRLVDLSDAMLDRARARFNTTPSDMVFEPLDYATANLGGPYRAIVSAISIHHIDDAQKRELFGKIYDSLETGGLFVNADQVRGASEAVHQIYHENWLSFVKASGVTEEEMEPIRERMKVDKLAPLEDQLGWLRDAGFEDVTCWYKHFSLAVYAGVKRT